MTRTTDRGLDNLAELVAGYLPDPRQLDDARLRLADTLFAYQLGRATAIGGVVDDLCGGPALPGAPSALAFRLAACIRYSEVDDLLLASCTSPGAIVLPCLAAAAVVDPAVGSEELLAAAVIGYGLAAVFGAGVGGPGVVPEGRWPTREIAPVTAALCTGRALGLGPAALAEAAALAAGWRAEGRLAEPARELSFARAVGIGVEAAHAARIGAAGRPATTATALRTPTSIPEGALEAAFDRAIFDARVKLSCGARQVMPALTAAAQAVAASGIEDVADIEAIHLEMPAPCAALVDVARPRNRLDSLRSAAYQLAALLFEPSVLWDVERARLTLLAEAERVDAMLRIEALEGGDGAFPGRWPARATIVTGAGRASAAVDDHPPARLDETLLAAKQWAFLGPDAGARATAAAALEVCRQFTSGAELVAAVAGLDARGCRFTTGSEEPGFGRRGGGASNEEDA